MFGLKANSVALCSKGCGRRFKIECYLASEHLFSMYSVDTLSTCAIPGLWLRFRSLNFPEDYLASSFQQFSPIIVLRGSNSGGWDDGVSQF